MALTELEITNRSSFASGQSFGDVGAYELLEGTARYAVDPVPRAEPGGLRTWIWRPEIPAAKWSFPPTLPCSGP